jgi:hypothetical protein
MCDVTVDVTLLLTGAAKVTAPGPDVAKCQ